MNGGSQPTCEPAIRGSIAAHLSLASGELDVHETASVLEPLHGTALTARWSALACLIVVAYETVSSSRSAMDDSSLDRACHSMALRDGDWITHTAASSSLHRKHSQ